MNLCCLSGVGLLFVFIVPYIYAIVDPKYAVTKPPIKREQLAWPNQNLEKTTYSTITNRNIKNSVSSSGYINENNNRYISNINEKLTVQNENEKSSWVFVDEDKPEDKNWDQTGWTPSQPCPDKATGQFPYQGDCRKFYNCWKGRGILQVCAPGTLFNSETLQCDFPSKVKCLDSSTYYSPVPVVNNNGLKISDNYQNGKSIHNQYKQPGQVFHNYQSNSNSNNPVTHSGVQPPNYQNNYPGNPNLNNPQKVCYEIPQEQYLPQPPASNLNVNPFQNSNPSIINPSPMIHPNYNVQNPTQLKNYDIHNTINNRQPINHQINQQPNYPINSLANNQDKNFQPISNILPDEKLLTQNGYKRIACFYGDLLSNTNQFVHNPQSTQNNQANVDSYDINIQATNAQPNFQQAPPLFVPVEHSVNPQHNSNLNYPNPRVINQPSSISQTYPPLDTNPYYQNKNDPSTITSSRSFNPLAPQTFYNTNNPIIPPIGYNPSIPRNTQEYNPSLINNNYQPNTSGYTPIHSPSSNSFYQQPQNTGHNANGLPKNHNIYNSYHNNPNSFDKTYQQSNQREPNPTNFQNKNYNYQPDPSNYNNNNPNYFNHNPNKESSKSANNPGIPSVNLNPHIPYYDSSIQPQDHTNYNSPSNNPSIPRSKYNSNHNLKSQSSNQFNSGNNVKPNNETKCPQGFRGLLPHPTICEKFLNCDHGITHIQDCGPGTVFNPTISVCDFPSNVNCQNNNNPNSDQKNKLGNPVNSNVAPNWNEFNIDNNNNEFDQINQETRHVPPIYNGVPTVEPNSAIENIYIRNYKNDSKNNAKEAGKTPWIPPHPDYINPYLVDIEVNNIPTTTEKAYSNDNYRHPRLPGHYIVQNITRTTSTTTESYITKIKTNNNNNKEIFTSSSEDVTPNIPILSQIYPAYIVKAPVSRQLVRLRGGSNPSEGYLELQISLPGWGIVCDRENSWNIREANIVCEQLGYERGAELTWQGRPTASDSIALKTIATDMVNCTGKEKSIIDCQIEKDNTCDPERHSVWIKCFNNIMSQCQANETSFQGKCYKLVVPRPEIKDETAGFSQAEALAHCQLTGGHLFDINSQKENDYISEWLLHQKSVPSIMTAGVGISLMGRSLWFWEGSADSLEYHNWWPGWGQLRADPPKTESGRGICVVAKHQYPCPGSSGDRSNVETSLCDAEYFFWDAEDCSVMSRNHPYICERKADKIGCIIGNGADYTGPANVTETGTECLRWDSDVVLPGLKYRISEADRLKSLKNHNNCRNVKGTDNQPWCFVRTQTGIKKEYCDIPQCQSQGLKKSLGDNAYKCGSNQFTCELNDCIPSSWVCDGQTDCKNGLDEAKCSKSLKRFVHYPKSKLDAGIQEKWPKTNLDYCADKCLQAKDFICHSFSYNIKSETCLLSQTNVGLSGGLLTNETEWGYYELESLAVDCTDKHICDNNKCINKTMVCDGHNDCGDRSDERNCTEIDKGFEIRLIGGKTPNEGRIEVKVLGEWGVICDDKFGMRDADVVCKEVGFSLGASEVILHSSYNTANSTTKFLVDDLDCRGNESSIRECDFSGWGVHDCTPEEVVGVICKVPGATCPQGYWQCSKSKECIPVNFLCDNVPDCLTHDDEDPKRCNPGVEVRLVPNEKSIDKPSAGRLEVKRFGVWGTVCDDDFTAREAEVVCKSLGFNGNAEVRKEAAFGLGEGIIWLDQVHCNGSESSIDKCLHHQWGQSNCKHDEDVSVICSNGPKSAKPKQQTNILDKPPNFFNADSNIFEDKIIPKECGTLDSDLDVLSSDFTPKVVAGNEVQKGTFPFQASIRAKTSIKSVHWCGAVIISPLHVLTAGHCLLEYTKDIYFVRAGDHDTEIDEGTEQEADIEEIYMHHEFNHGVRMNNDIALIKLKGNGFELNTWVRPICLPNPNIKYNADINCTISGWGTNGIAGSGYARRLHAVFTPILSKDVCTADYVYGKSAISSAMFCAGNLDGGADSCQGDSGGPFACSHKGHFTLYGITSWGYGCGKSNRPGVYTKVSAYIDWLNKKIHESMTV